MLDIERRLWLTPIRFGLTSGPAECRDWSGSKLFDTLMVFQKEFFEKVDFEKKAANNKTGKMLARKAPNTTAADGKFCNIFPNFGKK